MEYLGVNFADCQQISDLLFSRGICQGSHVTDDMLRAAETELMTRVDGYADIVLNYAKGKLLVEARPATPNPVMRLPQDWDILAAETGVVRSVEVFSGIGRIQPGQLVHKGDVLVSTGWQGQKNELNLVPCRAKVVAYLEKELTVACPLHREKEQIRRIKTDGFALVFGGRIFHLRKQRDPQSLPSQYGVRLLGTALPLTVWRSVSAEKETVRQTLTVKQAKENCIRTLNALLYARTPAIEILDREYTWNCSGETVYCTMKLRACADIAALPAFQENVPDAI